ncbi:Pheromone-processing carboxypeptidase KEX1, partial [Globisporangium polare]
METTMAPPSAIGTTATVLVLLELTSGLLVQTQAQRIAPSSEQRRRRQLHEEHAHEEEEAHNNERVLLQETQEQTDDLVRDLPGLDPSVEITHHAGRIGLSSGT